MKNKLVKFFFISNLVTVQFLFGTDMYYKFSEINKNKLSVFLNNQHNNLISLSGYPFFIDAKKTYKFYINKDSKNIKKIFKDSYLSKLNLSNYKISNIYILNKNKYYLKKIPLSSIQNYVNQLAKNYPEKAKKFLKCYKNFEINKYYLKITKDCSNFIFPVINIKTGDISSISLVNFIGKNNYKKIIEYQEHQIKKISYNKIINNVKKNNNDNNNKIINKKAFIKKTNTTNNDLEIKNLNKNLEKKSETKTNENNESNKFQLITKDIDKNIKNLKESETTINKKIEKIEKNLSIKKLNDFFNNKFQVKIPGGVSIGLNKISKKLLLSSNILNKKAKKYLKNQLEKEKNISNLNKKTDINTNKKPINEKENINNENKLFNINNISSNLLIIINIILIIIVLIILVIVLKLKKQNKNNRKKERKISTRNDNVLNKENLKVYNKNSIENKKTNNNEIQQQQKNDKQKEEEHDNIKNKEESKVKKKESKKNIKDIIREDEIVDTKIVITNKDKEKNNDVISKKTKENLIKLKNRRRKIKNNTKNINDNSNTKTKKEETLKNNSNIENISTGQKNINNNSKTSNEKDEINNKKLTNINNNNVKENKNNNIEENKEINVEDEEIKFILRKIKKYKKNKKKLN